MTISQRGLAATKESYWAVAWKRAPHELTGARFEARRPRAALAKFESEELQPLRSPIL